jgi:5'-nucleotidase
VKRVVSWGDGTAPQAWTGTGTALSHHYPALGRYVPSVTLSDAAGNSAVIGVPAVVIGDHSAPTGAFGVAPGTAWAQLTSVQITQRALADNYSPGDTITRTVKWADGSTHVMDPRSVGTLGCGVPLDDKAHVSGPGKLQD